MLLVSVVDPHDCETDGADGVDGTVFTEILAVRLLLQQPVLLFRARKYTVVFELDVYVLDELLVEVPPELVCQYHVIPLGDDPLVNVVDPHD